MSVRRQFANPFYVVLLVVGLLFCVTACAYGLLLFKGSQGSARAPLAAEKGLLGWVDDYGLLLIGGQLMALGAATVGAILTEDYWLRRADARAARNASTTRKAAQMAENDADR